MLLELSWFNKVYLILSLDGFGPRGEMMRKVQNWSAVEESIEFTRKMFPAIALKLAPTISMMNFIHLSDFIPYMIENFSFHPRDFKLSLLN